MENARAREKLHEYYGTVEYEEDAGGTKRNRERSGGRGGWLETNGGGLVARSARSASRAVAAAIATSSSRSFSMTPGERRKDDRPREE